uniref:MADF domain-containing protein n=1 Tax=Stegastes partitus TaxID=144197 RepID=A0A3B4Z1B4_9TELE
SSLLPCESTRSDMTQPPFSFSFFYRNRNKKELAWKKVSEEVGEPVESCKKSLRDTYLKERRKETERRSGSAAETGKRWKHSAVLSFLDPFVTPRETSGNMEEVVEEHRSPGNNISHLQLQGELKKKFDVLAIQCSTAEREIPLLLKTLCNGPPVLCGGHSHEFLHQAVLDCSDHLAS